MLREDRDTRQTVFLMAFSRSGLIGEACKEAGVGVRTVRDWRDSDEAFRAAYEDARETADDRLRSVTMIEP